MREKVYIFDTTLRDAEQVPGCQLNTIEKIEVARQLEKLGVDIIEAGFPISSPGDFNSVVEISKAVTVPTICALTRAVKKDIEVAAEALKFAKRGRIHTGIGTSWYHIHEKLNSTPDEIAGRAVEAVKYARRFVDDVEFYAEDAGRTEEEYLARVVEAVIKAGATVVNIPDTTGYCLPNEYGAKIAYLMNHVPNIDKAIISTHCHNDLGMATANTLAAVQNGARQVEVTINGLGERTGNQPLAQLAVCVNDMTGRRIRVVEKELQHASEMVQSISGKRCAWNMPVVGADVFTQTCGVHADGDKKGNLYANRLLPERFGRHRNYALGKLSGKASIDQNLETLGLDLDPEVRKKVLQEVIRLGDKKKSVSPSDLPFIIAGVLHTPLESRLKVTDFEVSTRYNALPKARVAVEMDGRQVESTATGDGGYDAFVKALRKCLKQFELTMPRLLDYEVRIPPGGKTDALVEATITWDTKGKSLVTTGIDSDQLVAAVLATEKMLNLVVPR